MSNELVQGLRSNCSSCSESNLAYQDNLTQSITPCAKDKLPHSCCRVRRRQLQGCAHHTGALPCSTARSRTITATLPLLPLPAYLRVCQQLVQGVPEAGLVLNGVL